MAKFNGYPCSRCGYTERYSSSRNCVSCAINLQVRRRKENPEAVAASRKASKDKRRDEIRKIERERYYEKREYRIKQVTEYRSKNKEKVSIWTRRAGAKRRAIGAYSKNRIKELVLLQRNRCACCKNILSSFEVDHIMPVSKGGTNDDNNIQLLCKHCNRSKGAKHPVDFMQLRGFLL